MVRYGSGSFANVGDFWVLPTSRSQNKSILREKGLNTRNEVFCKEMVATKLVVAKFIR